MANNVAIHIIWNQICLGGVWGDVPPMKTPMANRGCTQHENIHGNGGRPPLQKQIYDFLYKLASIKRLKRVLILKYA